MVMQQTQAIVLGILTVIIMGAVTGIVLNAFQGAVPAGSAAENITNLGLQGVSNVYAQFPSVGTMVGIGVLVGVVFAFIIGGIYLYRRGGF
jgi:hypothetical protein